MIRELRPIKESSEDFEKVEAELKALFRREIYLPLIKEFASSSALQNAKLDLLEAIRSGRLTFNRGTFSGKLNASLTTELKAIGAKFDRKTGTFKIPTASLPLAVSQAVSASEARFDQKMKAIDKKLAKILPEEIAEKVKISKYFDATLWKTEQKFKETIKGITVAPVLTDNARKLIADDWQNNMKLWVKDFTEKEITKLRSDIQKTAFAGDRYGSAVKTIQDSYGVSLNKAKFLASQETSLLMAKFKEARYTEAGVDEYKWGCVAGSKNHPVRPWHKALEGKIFKWSDPPITTKPGTPVRRNNPGEDYKCRCFAKPIVRFGDKKK